MSEYVMYIDDSGDKDYARDPSHYDIGPTRYFVFGGVITKRDVASRLAQGIQELKQACFADAGVEIKSNWLRMPQEREKRYLHPLGIIDDELAAFTDEFYDLIAKSDIQLVAGVVDKKAMQEIYRDRAYYPPAIAYELMMQRLQNHVGPNGPCHVVIDDMTGKNPKGSQHKQNLQRQHQLLRKHGSSLRRGMSLDALGTLKFVNSAHNDLVQVADVVGYNVFRQFRDHGDAWEQRGLAQLPLYDPFRRLVPKFRMSERGQISGYGVVKMPSINRIRWGLHEGRAAP